MGYRSVSKREWLYTKLCKMLKMKEFNFQCVIGYAVKIWL